MDAPWDEGLVLSDAAPFGEMREPAAVGGESLCVAVDAMEASADLFPGLFSPLDVPLFREPPSPPPSPAKAPGGKKPAAPARPSRGVKKKRAPKTHVRHFCTFVDCGYSSERRGNVRRHYVAKHTSERPYSCGFCNYASADSGAVTRHERQHTGARPAVCDVPGCTYSAPDYSNLGRHLRTHTGERPFECDEPGCSYKCAQKSSLTSHFQRRHCDDRNYACNQCDYRAKTSGDLRAHLARHVRKSV